MTDPPMDLVERLYRRLVGAVRERDGAEATTLTIGELYQDLIPYRGVRGELGVFELAEYENALIRLLAGEGGFLHLVDDDARRELAKELESPNPILGIYRDYASRPVELVGPADPPAATERLPTTPSEDAAVGMPFGVRDVRELVAEDAEQEGGESHEEEDEVVPLPEMHYPPPRIVPADATRVARAAAAPPPQIVAGGQGTRCIACRELLPDVEGLRFCPHCGSDQSEVPCDRCGSPIRADWNFCIRCGSRRPASAPAR